MFENSKILKAFRLDPQQRSYLSVKVNADLPLLLSGCTVGIYIFCGWGENALVCSVCKGLSFTPLF